MKKITVTLVKSPIGRGQKQIATCKALGLNKISVSKTFDATPAIIGMVNVVSHLVEVTEVA